MSSSIEERTSAAYNYIGRYEENHYCRPIIPRLKPWAFPAFIL